MIGLNLSEDLTFTLLGGGIGKNTHGMIKTVMCIVPAGGGDFSEHCA